MSTSDVNVTGEPAAHGAVLLTKPPAVTFASGVSEQPLEGTIVTTGWPSRSKNQAIYYEDALVTPEVAKFALEHMERNRPKKKNKIAEMVDDMTHGRWLTGTGETVKITKEGLMADGQNRMHAVIESGVSVFMTFCYNVEPEVMKVIDTGTSRTFGDIFYFANPDARGRVITSTANRMFRWDVMGERMSKMTGTWSNSAKLEYAQMHEREIISACAFVTRDVSNIWAPVVYATTRILLRRVDFGAAEEFLGYLTEGNNPPDTIMPVLWKKLTTFRRQNPGNGKFKIGKVDWPVSEVQRLYTLVGWKCWREGKVFDGIVPPKDIVKNYPLPR